MVQMAQAGLANIEKLHLMAHMSTDDDDTTQEQELPMSFKNLLAFVRAQTMLQPLSLHNLCPPLSSNGGWFQNFMTALHNHPNVKDLSLKHSRPPSERTRRTESVVKLLRRNNTITELGQDAETLDPEILQRAKHRECLPLNRYRSSFQALRSDSAATAALLSRALVGLQKTDCPTTLSMALLQTCQAVLFV